MPRTAPINHECEMPSMGEDKAPLIQRITDYFGPEGLYERLSPEQRISAMFLWRAWARPEQMAPDWNWFTWMYLAGRGSGKTRSGAEWVREQVEKYNVKRIGLVAATASDYRDTMIEGESGILAVCPPDFYPTWEPSKRRLTWPNGARAYCYSAEKPDRLRGPQHEKVWADEMASWARLEDTYDNLMFGLRLGRSPQLMVTTTPRPLKLLKTILAEDTTAKSIGSTYDNIRNLSPRFLRYVLNKYEGTRRGLQEIHAQILDDNPNGIFQREDIEAGRVRPEDVPPLERVVIPIDPAATSTSESNDTGIIPTGKATIGGVEHFYLLADRSVHGKPNEWGRAALRAFNDFEADRVIGEVNNGGEMVEHVIKTCEVALKVVEANGDEEEIVIKGREVPYKAVRASRGKVTRAEPVGALCEQGRLHVVGTLPQLEDELCEWVPGEDSPDRMDSAVWGVTELNTTRVVYAA